MNAFNLGPSFSTRLNSPTILPEVIAEIHPLNAEKKGIENGNGS
jgi:hypothetical protein